MKAIANEKQNPAFHVSETETTKPHPRISNISTIPHILP